MKIILVVSDEETDEFSHFITEQFSEEINAKKTGLIFTNFNDAFGILEMIPEIGICAIDLSGSDAPEFHDPEKPPHPAVPLLRNIWCKFRLKKIVIGFYQYGLDETWLIKFRYKPKVVCPIGKLKRKLGLQFKWIQWDLRGQYPPLQNVVHVVQVR